MFIDSARIWLEGGAGGKGCVSFRREKYVPLGGPDGGNGGRGGAIRLRARSSMRTLLAFRYRRQFRAERGRHGRGKRQHGRAGSDVTIEIPLGTIVREDTTEEILADLVQEGQEFLAARGGRGGRGNTRFKTAARQAPRNAEDGEPGEGRWLRLELRLLADAGLVGAPNAGKSTLLACISRQRSKIADYPFSTVAPHLGTVSLDDDEFCVVADIPGLIERAHEGRGLGIEFLRHLQRTRVLIHVVDLFPAEGNPIDAYQAVNLEVARFDEEMARKPQLVALNKMDRPGAQEALSAFCAAVPSLKVHPISAATGEGVGALLEALKEQLAQEPVRVKE